ncbi:energy-coupling factor transporter transmembrane protein EcfT [Allorhizobium sp. BGMRC 0089]|uniref:energy-coupling factor transporter transmembrane component T family protein n=1 Tax=Allorhizobium sonneratiae TaxID=2934936 RepID=UPI00203402D7|nr:energy-coupling factor transporter transmembrane protein EcfT [Allorhizobium sonneratiae]MCM2294508.1 energy-coupling factor transporter transmembrane protein EcfT [Allorhizobium sonneratiae]
MMDALNVEGQTWLHRLPVTLKLAVLVFAGLGLSFSLSMPLQAAAALVTLVLYARVGLSPKAAFARIRPLLTTILLLGLFNIYALDMVSAITLTFRLLAILFLSAAITATTPLADFMAAFARLLAPLERLGLVNAADASLAVGLVLRFVPDIAARYQALKLAHTARGIPVRLHRLIGPLAIGVLKDADAIADAIDARGIRARREKQKISSGAPPV